MQSARSELTTASELERPIISRLNKVDQLINDAMQMVLELEEKLSLVLRTAGPNKEESKDKEISSTELFRRLDGHAESLVDLHKAIESLHARVEL